MPHGARRLHAFDKLCARHAAVVIDIKCAEEVEDDANHLPAQMGVARQHARLLQVLLQRNRARVDLGRGLQWRGGHSARRARFLSRRHHHAGRASVGSAEERSSHGAAVRQARALRCSCSLQQGAHR